MPNISEKRKRQMIEEFFDGVRLGGLPDGLPKYIKKEVRERSNNSCDICGYDGVNIFSGEANIQVCHIDEDPANNFSWNLQALCPNCHTERTLFNAFKRGKVGRFRTRLPDGTRPFISTDQQQRERIQRVLDKYRDSHPELQNKSVEDVVPLFSRTRIKPEEKFQWISENKDNSILP